MGTNKFDLYTTPNSLGGSVKIANAGVAGKPSLNQDTTPIL